MTLPTPFLVGRVNSYLIEDRPLTLVDTGPSSDKTLEELERALAARGHAVEDLELILITHQHLDHHGLLNTLAQRSGAEVGAFYLLVPYLADFENSAAADNRFAQSVMRRHGVPPEVITALGEVAAAFRTFGSSATVTRPLRDQDVVELSDRRLRVLYRPGHSPSDIVFWDEDRRILIAGDHLIGHISSNPMVSRPLAPGAAPAPALISYIDSLRATRELPADVVLPGHGDPVVDHRVLIDERLRLHERRARRMLRMLDDGPRTGYEIAFALWGNVAVTQSFLTLSEVLGHMDLLIDQGRVAERESDGVVRFESLDA